MQKINKMCWVKKLQEKKENKLMNFLLKIQTRKKSLWTKSSLISFRLQNKKKLNKKLNLMHLKNLPKLQFISTICHNKKKEHHKE